MNRGILAAILWVFILFNMMGSSVKAITHPLTQAAPSILVEEWAKTWGGTADEAAGNIVIDGSGNLYVAGSYTGTVDFDPDPVKTDSHSSVNGTIDAFLSKFDANGTFLWAKTWGGGIVLPGGPVGRDVASGLVLDSNGNVYVSGCYQYTVDFDPGPGSATHTSNANSMNNIYLSKFSPDGTFQWVRAWGPSDAGGESYSVAYDPAGFIYVAGDFSGVAPVNFNPWDSQHPDMHTNHPPIPANGPLYFDSFLSKFDLNGNYVWAKTWGGEGYDDGPGVAVDGFGNVYVSGMYASTQTINFDPAGGPGGLGHPANDSGRVVDVFLSKFNSDGIFQWVKTWGGPGVDDAGGTILVDGANNLYVAGRFGCTNCDFDPGPLENRHSSNGDLDVFVSKFDPAGNFLWARTWGGSDWDAPGNIALDGLNGIYITGFFVPPVNFNPNRVETAPGYPLRDIFLEKISTDGVYQWSKTWGSDQEEGGYGLASDGEGNLFIVGAFSNTVDFNPDLGTDNHTSNGAKDAFLTKFTPLPLPYAIYLPMTRK